MKLILGALTSASLIFGTGAALAGPNYDVTKIGGPIVIDGSVDEDAWKNIPAIEGSFNYPWETDTAPKTTFKAGADAEFFYFSFVVVDADVVVLDEPIGERETVDAEDRVELFFSPSAIDNPVDYKLPTYYAVEVDPVGRVHDYSVVYYRDIDSEWGLKSLKASGKLIRNGYSVEGRIALNELKELALLKSNGNMMTGAYRAEFSKPSDDLITQWISWVDPETVVPDFHVQSSFGNFRFVK